MQSNRGIFGFVLVKCENCGDTRATCLKDKHEYITCQKCGSLTELKNLKRLYAHCECGKMASYLTNISDKLTDIACVQCRSLVAVEFNEKKNLYESIGHQKKKPSGRK